MYQNRSEAIFFIVFEVETILKCPQNAMNAVLRAIFEISGPSTTRISVLYDFDL